MTTTLKRNWQRRAVRAVAEGGGELIDLSALSARIDRLASTWNRWSVRRRAKDDPDMEVMGEESRHIDAVRTIRQDQGTEKWASRLGPDKVAAYVSDPDARAYVADADSLPWPSQGVDVRVAILLAWTTDYKGERIVYPGDAAFLARSGIGAPQPTVGVASSMADIQILGGEWMRLVLGVTSGDVMSARIKISAEASRRHLNHRTRR